MTMQPSNSPLDQEQLLRILTAIYNGDLSVRMPGGQAGTTGQIADTVNAIMDRFGAYASEVTRITREIGTQGKFGGQAEVPGAEGAWRDLVTGINTMSANLTTQIRDFAMATTAVANGDLAKKITAEARGEMEEWKRTVNIMVDQLNSFASEVTHLARDIGTDGRFGPQMEVRGAAGTWKDVITNINLMSYNLTAQVRDFATVTTLVANGDLSKKITVSARGEMAEWKHTINTMADQLDSFASEVDRIAREVTEGKFGGQADVRGAAGTWKDLIDAINTMSYTLTAQVRNISESMHSVVYSGPPRKATVDANGETMLLKEMVNALVEQRSPADRAE